MCPELLYIPYPGSMLSEYMCANHPTPPPTTCFKYSHLESRSSKYACGISEQA